jgi:chloramphenicol-sensitive protein RarD
MSNDQIPAEVAPSEAPPSEERLGVLYAGFAYCVWGVLPLYWQFLKDVSPVEVTAQRVLWCALFALFVIAVRGNVPRVLAIMRTPRTCATLAVSSAMLTINWVLYLHCIDTEQIVEASLGYYMTPLVSFVLGSIFFHEKLSRLRLLCIGLATTACVVQVIGLGHFPWLGLTLAVSFGFYGYLRKRTPVAALDGLFVETVLLLPLVLGFLLWREGGLFPSDDLVQIGLLIGAGLLTAVLLSMFAAGARRVRMSTLGFLQYLSPSLTLLLAVFVFHEEFTAVNLVSFGCIWTALVIVSLEGRRNLFTKPTAT